MRYRTIFFLVDSYSHISLSRLDKVGQSFAQTDEIRFCHTPRNENVVSFRVESDLSDEDICRGFEKLTRKSAKILFVKDYINVNDK